MLKKITSLILDSDINARTRLRETLKSIALKSEVEYARNLIEAVGKLGAKKYDCVFISSGLGTEQLSEAISKVRNISRSPKLLLIISLKPADQDSSKVAALFMQGTHGFICEPYSAEEIVQLIESARKGREISGDSDKGKLAGSAALLVRSAMSQIDKMARERVLGKEGKGYAGRELERISATLKELEPKLGDKYGEVLVEEFSNAEIPKEIPAHLRQRKQKIIPQHPGYILDKLIRERRISEEKLASTSGLAIEELKQLLAGQGVINEAIAESLARAVGETKTYWIMRQKEFTAYQEKQKKRG